MKNSWNVLWALALALPAYAQDPAAADAPPADSATPAEQVPAGATPPADNGGSVPYEAPPSDSAAAPAEAPAETPPAETPPSDTATAETPSEAPAESTPWHVYFGGDWVRDTLSVTSLNGYGAANYDTGMYRLRGGARLFDSIGAEAQIGLNRSEDNTAASPATKTKSYYGLFLVPTATLFETVELAFPVGYAMSKFESVGASASLNSVAYGLNTELPIRVFSAGLPDFRIEAGWMVYYQKTNARVYGLNAGVRYDFDVNGGNPFAGVGDKMGGFFKSLWPFGKDDAPAQ